MRNLQKAKPCKISRFEKWETAEKKPQAGLSGKTRETPNFGFAIAPALAQNGSMLKKISQARRKLGGFWPLLLWLPALWAGKAIFLAAAGMLADAQKFFEFDPNAPESSIDGILYRATAYCVFFIPSFAYALFVRFASPRETRFEKLAFSLPLAALFAAEGVIALSESAQLRLCGVPRIFVRRRGARVSDCRRVSRRTLGARLSDFRVSLGRGIRGGHLVQGNGVQNSRPRI